MSKAPLKEVLVEKSSRTGRFEITRPWWRFFNDIAIQKDRLTTRITASNSPYQLTTLIGVLMCDTDGGAITVNMYTGTNGDYITIANTGTSGNNVTVNAATGQTIKGLSTQTLYDEDVWDGKFQTTDFWQ